MEIRDKAKIIITETYITLPSLDLSSHFRPAFGCKSSADARFRCLGIKLIPQKSPHLIKLQGEIFEQVITKRFKHNCDRCFVVYHLILEGAVTLPDVRLFEDILREVRLLQAEPQSGKVSALKWKGKAMK